MNTAPFLFRDMRQGVIRPYSVSNFLAPENSVSHAMNVDFDTVIGKAVVRDGTTKLGATVASGRTPLGLANFVTSGAVTNAVVGVFAGASTATIYYYDTSWNASTVTNLNNSAKNRFAQIGDRIFRVNGVDAMSSSANANNWATTNCITTDSVIPSLVFKTKQRLLAAGYSGFRDRVYFSSVINPNGSPTLTWNTDQTTGDWIDINPDDGDNITAFAETSATCLVFKSKATYRLDVIAKTVDSDNLINIGAVAQESVVRCQGTIYFFSGLDIRRTTGSDFPEQISRLGVQDFIDAIPQANWSSVAAGTDGFNVYFSIGNVTINTSRTDQVTYNNVILKFSPRDQSWTIRSYPTQYLFFTIFKTTAGFTFVGSETAGNVQTLNSGVTDNTTPIYYDLQTQELEFGNRATIKQASAQAVVFMDSGGAGRFTVSVDGGDFKVVIPNLSERVNKIENFNFLGHWGVFRWTGESTGTPPIFEGFYIPQLQDQGIQ